LLFIFLHCESTATDPLSSTRTLPTHPPTHSLFVDVFGPIAGRNPDTYMYRESGISGKLLSLFALGGHPGERYRCYGDSIYVPSEVISRRFRGANLGAVAKAMNAAVNAPRTTVRCVYVCVCVCVHVCVSVHAHEHVRERERGREREKEKERVETSHTYIHAFLYIYGSLFSSLNYRSNGASVALA
jgi:hypothetical protein